MKRLTAIVLILVMAALLAACSSPKTQGEAAAKSTLKPGNAVDIKTTLAPEQAARTIQPKDGGEALYWSSIRSGGSSENRLSYQAITSYKEFSRLFGDRAEELGDSFSEKAFHKSFIVAVNVTVNTGGYTFGVNSAKIEGGEVKIDLSSTPPEAGAAVTQAFETHTVLIAFDQALYSEGLTYSITVNGQKLAGMGETE